MSELRVDFYDFQNDIKISNRIGDAFDGIVKNVKLDLHRQINVFIPGFRSNSNDSPSVAVRQALKEVPDIYLINFDYSQYSGETLNPESFERATAYFYDLSSAMGKFVAQIHNLGFPAKNIRAFGHSFGGQLAGFMGEAFKNTTGTKIARITSIEPADACFFDDLETQVRSGQAEFVEIVHCLPANETAPTTNTDAEFYYNREDDVYPGCYDNNNNTVRNLGEVSMADCAHIICVQEYMRTVFETRLFQACSDYDDYLDHVCANSEIVYSGYYHNNTPNGTFYVSTKVGYPVEPII